ncbi:MAG: hypothetical protein RTU92_10420 [Candidatus Thorarchaeota archaeon]
MTYRIQIPNNWKKVSVLDAGRTAETPRLFSEGNKKSFLLDSVPSNQTILISTAEITDTSAPDISHMRIRTSNDGVAFMADIADRGGFVSDVNITIVGDEQTYDFHTVVNPIFWNNNTYGRVVFGIPSGWYEFIVTATDENLNIATEQTWFHVVS